MISWIIGILSVVVIGVIADLLLSKTRIGKFIKSVFAAVTILVIILPIPSLIRGGFNWNFNLIVDEQVELDEGFLDFLNRVRLNSLARGVERQLESGGIEGVVVTIEGVANNQEIDIRRVSLDLSNAVFSDGSTNINIVDEVRTRVADYLDIDRSIIINL